MQQNKLRISPSSIKAYWEYEKKDTCGLLFERMYISRDTSIIPTKPMLYGRRFEYLVAGIVGRDKIVPPELLTPAGNYSKTDNQRVEMQAIMARDALKEQGFKILEVSEALIHDFGHYDLKNILDITAEKDGVKCIVELKSTGLLNNKWEDTGWSKERLHQKRKLLIQAASNVITAQYVWQQEVIPYYFYVSSSTNDVDAKFYQMVFTDVAIAEYTDLIEDAANGIGVENDLGFRAYPDHKRCAECPLKDTCKQFTSVPKIEKVIIETAKTIY